MFVTAGTAEKQHEGRGDASESFGGRSLERIPHQNTLNVLGITEARIRLIHGINQDIGTDEASSLHDSIPVKLLPYDLLAF